MAQTNVNATITLQLDKDADILGDHFENKAQDSQVRKVMANLHTPFYLALHRRREKLPHSGPKTEEGDIILFEAGAKLTRGELVQAVDFNNKDLVWRILDRGANVNKANRNGIAALQACLSMGPGEGHYSHEDSDKSDKMMPRMMGIVCRTEY